VRPKIPPEGSSGRPSGGGVASLRRVLAANMKAYRGLRGFSQVNLAERVETAPNYIAMIETGRKFPSDGMLEKIAGALGVEPEALFSGQSGVEIALQVRLLQGVYKEIHEDITRLLVSRIAELEGKRRSGGKAGARGKAARAKRKKAAGENKKNRRPKGVSFLI